MLAFDASSIVYAWDNYPPDIFPPLWDWMANQVSTRQIAMSIVALDEVHIVSPDCYHWLIDNGILVLPADNAVLQESMRVKGLLGIVGDRYHPKGVGENDIMIICTSKLHGVELVSDEERQQTMPQIPAKRKIPAVCILPSVMVTCLNFLDYIKRSGAVFR